MPSNLQLQNSSHKHLDALAICHAECFPASLSTKLGMAYIKKTLEWFLVDDNRFLFHAEVNGNITGYCGGFIPRGFGDGSSSGMLQYAFKEAVLGILKNPLLVFNKEVREFYPFIFRNIKNKIFGKPKIKSVDSSNRPRQKYTGLVVIGVLPAFRGTDVFPALMNYFEAQSKLRNVLLLNLSVRKDNDRAVAAYKKFGWQVTEEHLKSFVMQKSLS